MRKTVNLALAVTLLISSSPAFAADSEDLLPQPAKSAAPAQPTESKQAKQDQQAPSSPQASNTPNASSLTVDDVKIEGNRLVPTEDILKVVKTKRGDRFDRDQVVQDLKAINSLGYFDDQKLQGTPELTSSGVLLKIRVQENAPVTEFSFQGNQAVGSEELSKNILRSTWQTPESQRVIVCNRQSRIGIPR